MKTLTILRKTATLFLLLSLLGNTAALASEEKTLNTKTIDTHSEDIKAKQAYALAVTAYIWGYPMVVMQISRDATQTGKDFTAVNHVRNTLKMVGPEYSKIQSVNSDTLYSSVWFDLKKEPYIFHIPNANGRYYTFQFIDAFTNNFFYASTRTKGSQEQKYALLAPGWTGKLPQNVIKVVSPTPTGFIIGRWFVANQQDVPAVNKVQKQISMTPLSAYRKPYTQAKGKMAEVKKYHGELAFFEQLGDVLSKNGAPKVDAGLLGLLKNIGLSVAHGFDASTLSKAEKKALARAIVDGKAMLAEKSAHMGKEVNGWQLSPVLEQYFGTDYLFRAAIGYQAMFVNTPIEAYYPSVFKDSNGKILDGTSGKYTLTFEKGKLPPVGAFWSVTLYDAKNRLMVKNQLKRYKVGSADHLKVDKTGATTIYIQHDSPGKELESNWLPAPKEPFYMLFRYYQPDIEVLNGQYELPGIEQIK